MNNKKKQKNGSSSIIKKRSSHLFIKKHKLSNDTCGQVLVLMGLTLALSIFILASIPMELADLDIVISNERATALLTEFQNVKDAFGKTLNYNLVNVTVHDIGGVTTIYFYGDMTNIFSAFNQTKNSYYILEMNHDIFFSATLNSFWYSSMSEQGPVYSVDVTMSLTDGKTDLTERVIYSIVCSYEIS